MKHYDRTVAVIGAGIIGLSCATRLQQDGWQVTLIDRQEPGHGASWGNAGHIATEQIYPLASLSTLRRALPMMISRSAPLRIEPRYLWRLVPWLSRFVSHSGPRQFRSGTSALKSLLLEALPALNQLLHSTDGQHHLKSTGSLLMAESDPGMRQLHRMHRSLTEQEISMDSLTACETRDRVPGLCSTTRGALLFNKTGHVSDPYLLCNHLYNRLRQHGARFINRTVTGFEESHDHLSIRTAGESIRAHSAVIATGAYGRQLIASTGYDVPLETERGYHLNLDHRIESLPMPVASAERNVIVTPLIEGTRITGGVEFAGLEHGPHRRWTPMLEQHLRALFPGTDTRGATSWLGFRPSLPDHLPVIDRHPMSERILLAFGHQHLGLTLSAVTADLIVTKINRQPEQIDTRPFRLDRFGMNRCDYREMRLV